MPNDEQLIRDLIAVWMTASAKGDLQTILTLMDEDVVFLIPGQPPMRGRDAFAASFSKMPLDRFRLEVTSNIKEIQVNGDWAYCWNQLTVNMVPAGSANTASAVTSNPQSPTSNPKVPPRRSGYTLSILRKKDDKWVLFRDANLLAPDPPTSK